MTNINLQRWSQKSEYTWIQKLGYFRVQYRQCEIQYHKLKEDEHYIHKGIKFDIFSCFFKFNHLNFQLLLQLSDHKTFTRLNFKMILP